MNNTREKILQTALNLFNEYGSASVSLRQIAVDTGISQGNLNYHFKLKEDLIEALYYQLVTKMDLHIEEISASTSAMELLYLSTVKSMEQMYAFRFLLIDFMKIMREQEGIRKHYYRLQKERNAQFMLLFKQLIDSGMLRKEEIPNEYARFYERLNILGDNWINVHLVFHPQQSINYYALLLLESIYPYLTVEGKEAYRKISN